MHDPYDPTYCARAARRRRVGAMLLHQYRDRLSGAWRVVVRYSTVAGSTYQLGQWADESRRVESR